MSAAKVGVAAIATALLAASSVSHAGAPLWQRLLRWAGGESSATTVPTDMMGKHLQVTVRPPPQPGDEARAQAILVAARSVLELYRDVADAEAAGYSPFAATGRMGEEVHYTNYWRAGSEKRGLDYERPASILYRRTPAGMQAVGVMYTAPATSVADELDRRVPLGIGTWHRHVHFCGWPGGAARSDWDGPGARFGFAGSIDDEVSCEAAGGYWIPLVFGWMTHIYPNERAHDDIWIGRQMMVAAGPGGGYACSTPADGAMPRDTPF